MLAGAALELAAVLNRLCLAAVVGIAEQFAQAPGAELEVTLGSPAAVAGAYVAMAAVALGGRRAARRIGPAATAHVAAWRRLPRRQQLAVGAAAAALIAVGAVRWLAPPPPPDELTISFLDVGQGDATLVQTPEGGAVLFDGGPPEARAVRLLRRAGVRRPSALVATHQSRDHQGGLLEVVGKVPWTSSSTAGTGPPTPRSGQSSEPPSGAGSAASRGGRVRC